MLKLKKTKKEEKQAANQQLVKETNLTLIFNLINRYGPVSRADLANITGLSPTTVSSLAEELIKNDIIVETGEGATTTSGRKPIMLEVNPAGGYIASVEMVTEGFFFYLYDLKCNQVLGKKVEVTDYSTIGQEIVVTLEKNLQAANIDEVKLFGICLGVPGLIDTENNRVTTSTVIPIDESNDFYYYIKDRYNDIPILLGNESWFSAYAEKEFGSDSNVRNLIFIDINVGVGSGIILNGQIFTGSLGLAGEIGHITIDINAPGCKCGNRGCLETMVSIPSIFHNIVAGIKSGRDTIVKDVIGNNFNKINIDIVREAFSKKDKLVSEVIDDTAKKLAFGITNIINLLNPEEIVIGGEITKLGNEFLQKVKKYIDDIQLKPNKGRIQIRFSLLKGNTVTLGGAKYVLDNIFEPGVLLNGMHL
ncbi:MAG: ROK family transcriptional regulator [Firmicutes bacterium]|nr:ROK family transcriptional regulator [Bacillota bacterium]